MSPQRVRRASLEYLKISIFGAGLALFWATLHGVVLPARIQEMVSGASKNSYLGLLTFGGLVLAMLVQPFAGALSDRSMLRWGQRRPFIFLGTSLALAVLPGLGGASTFLVLLLAYCGLQLCTNIAQAPFQAFIPDLVPPGERGRAAGAKSLAETLSVIILLRVLAHYAGMSGSNTADWMGPALIGVGALLFLGMATTLVAVKEKPPLPHTHPPLLSTLAAAFRLDFRGRRDFLWFLLSRLLVLMALGTLQTFAFYYLSDFVQVATPAAAATNFVLVTGAGMMASIYPAAWISDRLDRKPVLLASGALGVLAIAVFLTTTSYASVLISSGLLGASAGSFISTNWALATDLVPPGEEAAYLGLTNLATAGAGAVARLIGPVIDYLNVRSPGEGYYAMLLACAVYFIAGTLLILKIKGGQKVQVPAGNTTAVV